MNRTSIGTVALSVIAVCISSAHAAININEATIQNGQVVIAGNQAQRGAPISWEGVALGIDTNNGGVFRFATIDLPFDCVGLLKIGTEERHVVIDNCTADITIYEAAVPKTGQTTSYATGDDGDLQKGVALPNPRFTDNLDGSVTDNLTGLIWLKNAWCWGNRAWAEAVSIAKSVGQGACGLTDGSTAGQWRLPNVNELRSLVDMGIGQMVPGHPFTNLQEEFYWSSTTYRWITVDAWTVRIGEEGALDRYDKTHSNPVTAVRGP